MISILLSCCSKTTVPTVKEGFIEVTGGRVWYKMIGIDKPGIPLLVLHGGPGAPHDYLESLEFLANDRPVVFYDQLGCGKSDRPSDTLLWTVDRFVEELVQVRDAINLKDIHLLGQSWGSMLAVEYMLNKNPSGIHSLILSAPFLSTSRWVADQQYWISQLPENVQDTIRKYEGIGDYAAPAYQEAMNIFYAKHVCRMDPWPECLLRTFDKMGKEVYEYMFGPSEFTQTGTLKNRDLSESLHLIKIPVLFTCGEYDEARPESVRFFQHLIPGSEAYVFEGASHSHHLEKQEEYHRVVGEFLRKNDTILK
jgi:proline iminopeptidase